MTHQPTLDLPPDRYVGLRAEVGALRRRERRRTFPASIRVGGHSVDLPWPLPDWYDDGLLHDLVDALLDRLRTSGAASGTVPTLRLTRPGVPEPHDLDLRVAAVVDRVTAAHACAHEGLVVLTRFGWLDPRTGEARRWKRLRIPAG